MKTIGIIGAGVMGCEIALDLALKGFTPILKDLNDEMIEKAKNEILKRYRQLKFMKVIPKIDVLSVITFTEKYEDLKYVDLIIENATESIEIKKDIYLNLREICGEDTFYMVNTSCIPIYEIGILMEKPKNVIGAHFMNPVTLNPTVELIVSKYNTEEDINKAKDYLKSFKKKSIIVKDSPGFVSNRLSHLFMNEAANIVMDKIATPEAVDQIFKSGYKHAMGPLETIDLIGVDTVIDSLSVLYKYYKNVKFECSPLLIEMREKNLLGRKSGEGFYKY